MAKLLAKPNIDLNVTILLNESEVRALDALSGYGDDEFVKAFYEKLGVAYMRDHEAGLRSFLKSIREMVPGIISRVDDARKAFEGNK